MGEANEQPSKAAVKSKFLIIFTVGRLNGFLAEENQIVYCEIK